MTASDLTDSTIHLEEDQNFMWRITNPGQEVGPTQIEFGDTEIGKEMRRAPTAVVLHALGVNLRKIADRLIDGDIEVEE